MTFAIAEILADTDGRIAMVADTKLTHYRDETKTRRIYDHPCLKIVILDDDLAVAFAGDDPDRALKFAAGLRGRSVAEVVEALRQYSADKAERDHSKSFLIAKRAPAPQLWRIRWGEVETAGRLPRLWIGDPAAFELFQRQHQSALLDRPAEFRLLSAMMTLVLFDDIPSVGGYITRVAGDTLHPFRFHSDPVGTGPWETEGTIVEHNGEQTLTMRVPPGVDPSRHSRIGVPGRDATFGAMAFFIPEITTAWLWTHAQPWEAPIKFSDVRSMYELVRAAEQNHGQLLSPARLIRLT
ncbi:hypothetical protein ABW17_01615 [Mycobacterium nebraskense]|uniref:hypothetical protein n=1 Tax=Mycobacterium nebraskense TaxID=244292 RepID=UPI0006421BD3|nr:hypothetical protein [Mycobacterium nebraskense]KLO46583.1 hypothetical protein ABW17_01615 [Mycobacterium nebraskense]